MFHSNKKTDNDKEKSESPDTESNTEERNQLNRKRRELPVHGRTGEFELLEGISQKTIK